MTCLSAARKLKKIGQQKSPEEDHPAQEHFEAVQSVSPKAGPSYNSQVVFINILESIEPEVVNAGHDYCQPDSAATLLTSLNELGERQLVKVVKWAKGLPGRRPYIHHSYIKNNRHTQAHTHRDTQPFISVVSVCILLLKRQSQYLQ